MSDNPDTIVQKIILIAAGVPSSVRLRDDLLQLYEAGGGWELVAARVDAYMNSQIQHNPSGVSGLVQAVALNGLGLKLSDNEAMEITRSLVYQGIDSWSKLFVLIINELNGDLRKVLDHRAIAAENFTDLLINLNKDDNYQHLPALNASREWIQGIGASDASLLAAKQTVADLIAKFNNGATSGTVLDGYVQDATVFIDENSNGALDAGEYSTPTNATGVFLVTDNTVNGAYTALGGTDLATGNPFIGALTAPAGALILTPLTTLIALMMRSDLAPNIDTAEEWLFKALQLPRVDLSVFDPIATSLYSDISSEQVVAVKVQAAITQIVNVFNVVHTLMNRASMENSIVTQATQETLLAHLINAAKAGQWLNLSHTQTLAAIINDIATALGYVSDDSISAPTEQMNTLAEQTAELLHALNSLVQKSASAFETGQNADSVSALSDMIKVQMLAQTDVAQKIATHLSSNNLTEIISQFAGEQLLQKLDTVNTGFLDSQTLVNDGSPLTNPSPAPTIPLSKNHAPVASNDRVLHFDGVDDYVQIGDNSILEMTATMTMEAWINPESSNNVNQLIINKEGEYEVALFPDGTIRWAFANTDPGWAWVDTGQTVPMNEWSHIAVSYDNGIVKTFVNGALVHTYNGSGIIGDAHGTLDDLLLGGRSNNPANKYFAGLIEEARIWNIARTDVEIASNYNKPLSGDELGLIGNWRLTEDTGIIVNDYSASGNDGTLGDGNTIQQPSWSGYSAKSGKILDVPATLGVLSNDRDADGDILTAKLVADVNNGTLNLNPDGSFTYSPNANFFGSDSFTYTVNDGVSDGNIVVAQISVSNINSPVITSNGGTSTANISINENKTFVTSVTATDADDGDALTYTISGGEDLALFNIDASSGILSFKSTPDFENPTDTGLDNSYEVVIEVSDGKGGIDRQKINVAVADQDEINVTTTADNNDSGIVAGNLAHDIDWLNAHMGSDAAISLREAIIAANNTANGAYPDAVLFNIAGAGPHTISINAGGLPEITDAIHIYGNSDPDFAGTPVIELDGSSAGNGINGLVVDGASAGSHIRGLAIQNFHQNGLLIKGGNTTIAGNYIGLDADGVTLSGNNTSGTGIQGGIRIESADNTIGGLVAADRNIISGNVFSGIAIAGAGATGNQVIGNYIGTDASGTLDRGNTQEGIEIDAANNNVIGGTQANMRNIISGNGSDGIEIDNADSNIVQGNYIGTDITGTLDLGNSRDGIDLNANGVEGATGNIIGGTNANASNLIFGNDMHGIEVRDTPTVNNLLLGNRIFGNGLLGINLGPGDIVTSNDAGDNDTGPNSLQNFPVLGTADIDSSEQLTIDGSLDTDIPDQDYRIEFFRNTLIVDQDATGYGEGQDFLGYITVTTDGSGSATFSAALNSAVTAGEFITATATRDLGGGDYGGTSEFSLNVTAAAVNDTPVAKDDPGNFFSTLKTQNPLGYWRLGEDNTGIVHDEQSLGNNGTFHGVTLGRAGALSGDTDTAAYFNGTSDYVEIAHNPDYLLDAGTVQFWFKANSLGGSQTMFSKDSTNFDSGGHLNISVQGNGEVEVRLQSTTDSYFVNSVTRVTASTWHHVAFTFGSDGMELYVNGQLEDTNAYTGGLATTSGGAGNFEPITFGASQRVSDDLKVTPLSQYFNGFIDEVGIINGQLSAATIQNLYAQSYSVVEDDVLTVHASEGVLSNDYDAEDNALTITLVTDTSNGVLNLNPDGSFTYTPDANFAGIDSFTYKINDGIVDSGIATVKINITNVNDAPTITSDGGTASANLDVNEGNTVVTTVTAADVDAGSTLTYRIQGGSDQAFFNIDANNGVLSFKIAPDFEIPVDFNNDNVYEVSVQADDNIGGSDVQSLFVMVNDIFNF